MLNIFYPSAKNTVKLFLLFLIFSFATGSSAQNTLALAVGGAKNDQAYSVVQTADGGYVMAGQTDSSGVAATRDGIITKISSTGVPQWTTVVGGTAEDYLRSIVKTFDGGFITAGYTNSFGGAGDIYVVKLDSLGVVDWTKAVGTSVIDKGEQIIQTADSGYAVAGSSGSGGGSDMYMAKLDASGNLQWDRKMGQVGSIADIGFSITEAHGGGYVIGGYTYWFVTGNLPASSNEFYAVKLSSTGAFQWGSVLRNPFSPNVGNDYGKSICKTSDGGYVLAGEFARLNTGGGSYNTKYGLMKLNGNGSLDWTACFGTPTNDNNARRIIETSDNGLAIIGGMTHPTLGLREQYLVKFDSDGNPEWNRTFGSTLYGDWLGTPRTYPDGNEGYGLVQTSDDGYAVAGFLNDNNTTNGISDQEIHFVKFDENIDNCHTVSSLGGSIPVGGTVVSLGTAAAAGGSSRVIADTRSTEAWHVIDFCLVGINANITYQNIPCAGQCTGTAAAHPTGGTAPYSYIWNTTPVQTTDSVSELCVGSYIVTITDANSVSGTFSVTISASPSAPASVTITASSTTFCPGTPVNFNATSVNGGPTPSYQWLLNEQPVGTNSPTYSNSNLNSGDTVKCVMTSSLPCATGSPATSNQIIVSVSSLLSASVSISASDTTICPGEPVTFTATPTNGGNNPTYQWRVNNNPAGANSSTFSSSSLNNNDTVTCVMTSDLNCVTGSPATSATIIMVVGSSVDAGFITAAPDSVCSGGTSTLTIVGGTGSAQWQSSSTFNNFTNINGATQNSYTTPVLTQNTFYRFYVTAGNCSDTSGLVEIVVKPVPAPPSLAANDTLICASDSTEICAPNTFGSYLWNTGENTSCIYAHLAGGYWVSVTADNGCFTISTRKNISIYPVTSVSIVRQGDTLSSFNAVSYQWFKDGIAIPGATSPVYVASQPGNYSVQILDVNGCYSMSTGVLVTGLGDLNGDADFSIYPNPALDVLQMEINREWVGLEVEMYETSGKLVVRRTVLSEFSKVDISKFASGIYLVKLNGHVRKFIKQ